tara:strand:+ start:67 stop:300 length:234 start_codon:yes stop_codon:yes gene_type:complete
MSRKLIASILILSFAFLELLAVRQEQLNTVYEMSKLHNLIDKGNEQIATLSIEIEFVCSPSHIQEPVGYKEIVNATN